MTNIIFFVCEYLLSPLPFALLEYLLNRQQLHSVVFRQVNETHNYSIGRLATSNTADVFRWQPPFRRPPAV